MRLGVCWRKDALAKTVHLTGSCGKSCPQWFGPEFKDRSRVLCFGPNEFQAHAHSQQCLGGRSSPRIVLIRTGSSEQLCSHSEPLPLAIASLQVLGQDQSQQNYPRDLEILSFLTLMPIFRGVSVFLFLKKKSSKQMRLLTLNSRFYRYS